MKDCNAKAAGKTGDERKQFMSACLPPRSRAPAKMTQQERMKACNAKAGDKKGDERKAFMSACLSGKDAAAAPKMTQQEKMKACNTKAGDKKGDERKAVHERVPQGLTPHAACEHGRVTSCPSDRG